MLLKVTFDVVKSDVLTWFSVVLNVVYGVFSREEGVICLVSSSFVLFCCVWFFVSLE